MRGSALKSCAPSSAHHPASAMGNTATGRAETAANKRGREEPQADALPPSKRQKATAATADSAVCAFIGDSTLDNVFWTRSRETCVSGQLRTLMQKRVSVVPTVENCAVAGFTSSDVLHGAVLLDNTVLDYRINTAKEALPGREEAKDAAPYHPLTALKSLTRSPDLVVVAVGSNDVQLLVQDLEKIPEAVKQFHANFPRILEEVSRVCEHIMICLQFRPSVHSDSDKHKFYESISEFTVGGESAPEKLNQLMETIYPKVLSLARGKFLPVIDLANSFDINDATLYEDQIEPSSKGCARIARLIDYAMHNHHWDRSLLYTLPPGSAEVQVSENSATDKWLVQSTK